MKNRSWGKKEDGTHGFITRPVKKTSPAIIAQKIMDDMEKARQRVRPNYIPDYKPPEVEEEKPFIQVEDPHFSPTDPCWLFLVNVIQAEIMILRAQNDSQKLNAEGTASIRGEIKRLKKMLNLPTRIRKGDEKHLLI